MLVLKKGRIRTLLLPWNIQVKRSMRWLMSELWWIRSILWWSCVLQALFSWSGVTMEQFVPVTVSRAEVTVCSLTLLPGCFQVKHTCWSRSRIEHVSVQTWKSLLRPLRLPSCFHPASVWHSLVAERVKSCYCVNWISISVNGAAGERSPDRPLIWISAVLRMNTWTAPGRQCRLR